MRLNPFTSTNQAPSEEDYGFGTKVSGRGVRLLDKHGNFNVLRTGADSRLAYHWLIEMSWWRFFSSVLAYYVGINLLLGIVTFLLDPRGIEGIPEGPWWEELTGCFFFSIQTFTTVGYGSMAPITLQQQLFAGLGALIGLMSLALATGLFFARFSQPRKLILFSGGAVITSYQEGMAFQFRIANRAYSKLINVSAQVVYSWVEEENGERSRHFKPLTLERDEISMFPLNWTIVHPITPKSPLHACDHARLRQVDGEFVVQVSGYDETYARQIYAHTSYRADCIRWSERFVPMYHPMENGRLHLHLDRIDQTEPVDSKDTSEDELKPAPGTDVEHL